MSNVVNIEDLSRQVAQLGTNCRWLIGKMDEVFYALCPNKPGTWQQRAEMAAQAAVEHAQRSANSDYAAALRVYNYWYKLGNHRGCADFGSWCERRLNAAKAPHCA